MRRVVAAGLAGALLLLALFAGDRVGSRKQGPAHSGSSYQTELSRSSAKIAWLRRRAVESPDSWTALEGVALAHLERARLTGDFSDYEAADSLIDAAFARAPLGAGPHLARAQLHFTLHRLDRVEADLEDESRRVVLDDPGRAAIEGLRAEVALQEGSLEKARRGFERTLALHDNTTSRARLAQCLWMTGETEAAEAEYLRALRMYHGESTVPRAWTHLQLGLMDLDAGRLTEALVHYRAAEAELPGWWMVEEHIAEVLALQGETQVAVAMYEDLVERTGNPEFMDQLARIHRKLGEEREARRWIQRARIEHEARVARLPEAARGHAEAHFREFGGREVTEG